jgi:hypothetical protein
MEPAPPCLDILSFGRLNVVCDLGFVIWSFPRLMDEREQQR